MLFYLGTHVTNWLAHLDIPLFISRRRLCKIKTLPRARGGWALDSGGFSELSMFGKWTITPQQYVKEVRRYQTEIGGLQWAAPMDWMVETTMLKKTGLTVAEHQQRTIENYLELLSLAPELPWVPVLQGWEFDDYLWHLDAYQQAGIDLAHLPLVGLGSICRRQATSMVEVLVRHLAQTCGLRLHGFGVKLLGLAAMSPYLESADSMAWSFTARWQPVRLKGCTHKNCANCRRWALQWHGKVLKVLENNEKSREEQLLLF